MAAVIRRWMMGISPRELVAARERCRHATATTQARTAEIVDAFVHGYDAAVDLDAAEAIAARVGQLPAELRGFSWEGVGMALDLRDRLMNPLGGTLLPTVLASPPGRANEYMLYVGVGWAMARIGLWSGWTERRLGPTFRGLIWDGLGFHDAFFDPDRILGGEARKGMDEGQRRGWYQGVGRALWFILSADVPAVLTALPTFPEANRADVWAGLGLATTYAGLASDEVLRTLHAAAGPHAAGFVQGSAFAVTARHQGDCMAPHSARAARLLTGQEPEAIWEAVFGLREGLPEDQSAYEAYRGRVQAHFGAGVEG